MTTLGWIISVVLCVAILVLAVLVMKYKFKAWVKVVAAILALALCVGVYFGGMAIFPAEKTEEPVVEETGEENAETEVPAGEETVESEGGNS